MHAYLATICRDIGADLVRVGGVADHIHILVFWELSFSWGVAQGLIETAPLALYGVSIDGFPSKFSSLHCGREYR
jgi:hypothetical protein